MFLVAAVESQRENYASLNERFQSQCAWMSDLSLAQLGVPWKFIPQSPTPQGIILKALNFLMVGTVSLYFVSDCDFIACYK